MDMTSALSSDQIEEAFRLLRLGTEAERAALGFDFTQLTCPQFQISYAINVADASVAPEPECQTSAKSSTKP